MRLELMAAEATPYVLIDLEKYHIVIKGESYPEDAFLFYEPLWEEILTELKKKKSLTLTIELALSYMNSSSTRCFYKLFEQLEEATEFHAIHIHWYYLEEDEMGKELGEGFRDDTETVQFSFFAVDVL